ncbi:MAG: hypothetical protein ACAH80_07455 [Alphaproteobacteria bacterium]
MTYWGPIRRATLKNLSDNELHAGFTACQKASLRGMIKLTCGMIAGALSFTLPPLVPFLPAVLFIAAPVLAYKGYKEWMQNVDGVKAHRNEAAHRVLQLMRPTQPAPAPAAAPEQPVAPVFNGQAAVVLDEDITTMKTIKLAAKAAPAVR